MICVILCPDAALFVASLPSWLTVSPLYLSLSFTPAHSECRLASGQQLAAWDLASIVDGETNVKGHRRANIVGPKESEREINRSLRRCWRPTINWWWWLAGRSEAGISSSSQRAIFHYLLPGPRIRAKTNRMRRRTSARVVWLAGCLAGRQHPAPATNSINIDLNNIFLA